MAMFNIEPISGSDGRLEVLPPRTRVELVAVTESAPDQAVVAPGVPRERVPGRC